MGRRHFEGAVSRNSAYLPFHPFSVALAISLAWSLMGSAVLDPKQMAHWISAPKQGIKGRPVDFEYVRRA